MEGAAPSAPCQQSAPPPATEAELSEEVREATRDLERSGHRRERPLYRRRGQPVFSPQRGEAAVPARKQHPHRVPVEGNRELLRRRRRGEGEQGRRLVLSAAQGC